MVEVGPVRHVAHAVGRQREQRVDVVGRNDSERGDAAQRAHVLADLLGRVRVTTHQLERGMVDDAAHRLGPRLSGRPLHHAEGHVVTPELSSSAAVPYCR